ncbi:Ig-like domain-containing protein, partial [Methanobrevibacter sp.]|uniref:Ig-like domain-containing protein n=1 Tax=Methanobrevibacter sp. TaxID=66852 RepID=UPI003870B297
MNILSINATDNNNLTTGSIHENTNITNIESDEIATSIQAKNENTDDNLLQGNQNNKTILNTPPDNSYWNAQNGAIYNTRLTMEINDTSSFNITKNITINIHLEWNLYMSQSYYESCKIHVYENNSLIHIINISDQNLEYNHNTHQTLDVTFPYTLKDRTEIKATLLEIDSNTMSFEEMRNNLITNLRNNSIIVNNNYFSNESWTNQIKFLKKAIDDAPSNSILYLNNVEILNDEDTTIFIDKNLTIIGNNCILNGLEHGTIFTIDSQANVNFINLTFTHTTTNYLIKNEGNLKITNNNFNNNIGRLIINNGNLILENSTIENTTKNYYAVSCTEIENTTENGLIYNTKTLLIKNTSFNNIELHPFTINGKEINWEGIIVNHDKTIINGCEFTNINYRVIYNKGILETDQVIIENISSNIISYSSQYINKLNNTQFYFSYIKTIGFLEGSAIYNNNQTIITNMHFQNIFGNNGGAIYNNDKINIINTTFQTITGTNGGAIYNNNCLTVENSLLNGASIYNKIDCIINNSRMIKSNINNDGNIIINNTTIKEYNGLVLYNNGIMVIKTCQITNNHGSWDSNIILNTENGKLSINKSLIKDNVIQRGTNGNWDMYWGVIKNNGLMEILSCIFDNNAPSDWDEFFGGEGSINIYNNGELTVRYSYLLNAQYYVALPHAKSPTIFLYNTKTAILNYNFFCLNPSSIIKNTNPNYNFIPSFDDDYYPIELNQNINITLTLSLTNGTDTIPFNDWDKLPNSGLNMSIYMNNKTEKILDALLQNNITFMFNNTNTKGECTLFADFGGYTTNTIVDIGKEFADMIVEYNNVTYNDGNNVTFKIKVTDNNTPVSGNITLTFNNKKYQIRLNNGTCNFTMPSDLKPNNYTVKIEYNGNEDYFKIRNRYYQFTIHKIQTNITLDAPEVKIGQNGELTIKISPSTANMNGILYVDGKAKTRADTNSIRTINLKNYGVGVYNLTVVFDDDEYYLGGTASTLFIVSKYETNLTVESHDIKAGENETLNITINPGDVRGNAVLKINNETRNIFINDTTTPITLTNLEEGTYQVTVYYPGDAKYNESTAATTFSVSRITSHLTVDLTQNINLTGNIKIQANPVNCTGEVAIYVNNDMTILNLTNGSIKTQIKLKRGSNYIYVHYNGDRYYSISSWNTSFTIEGIPVLSLETQKLETDKTGYVRINLTDTNNIPYEYTNITIEFQNTTTVLKSDENGTVYYPVKAGAGTYNITASYGNASITKTLTVRTQSILNVNIAGVNEADDVMVYVTLTDCANNKLTGDVLLEINGNYYRIIVKDGTGSRNLGQFKQASYTYTSAYQGNNILWSSNTTGSFKVNKDSYKITGNKNIAQYYGAT